MTFLRPRFAASLIALPLLALAMTGCLGYPAEGAVATPTAPGQSGGSRLPQLLAQLQGSGAGLELFDAPTSQVAAAQDQQQNKFDGSTATISPGSTTPRPTSTVAGTRTPGSGTDSRPLEPTQSAGDTATPTPTEPPATATPTPTETAKPEPTELPETPTPTATIPTEGGLPTEGSSE
ncbi:MAG: hypothetical protein ACM3S1_08505 [Hyphomicrobiales bacterium]